MRKMHQTARAMMRAISSGRRKSAEAAHLERALGKIVFRESKGVQGKMDRLNALFNEGMERAKKEGPIKKSPREMDLD